MDDADAIGRASLDGQAPRVVIYVRLESGRIERATFQAFGCGYTIAACSVLTELVKNKTVNEARSLGAADIIEALDGMPADRQFCADLAIKALHSAIGEDSQPQLSDRGENG